MFEVNLRAKSKANGYIKHSVQDTILNILNFDKVSS